MSFGVPSAIMCCTTVRMVTTARDVLLIGPVAAALAFTGGRKLHFLSRWFSDA